MINAYHSAFFNLRYVPSSCVSALALRHRLVTILVDFTIIFPHRYDRMSSEATFKAAAARAAAADFPNPSRAQKLQL